MQGNALHLKKLEDNTYDLTLLFGPMYHLMTKEEKIQALSEAKRVTKPGGIILVAYVMNEYAVVDIWYSGEPSGGKREEWNIGCIVSYGTCSG